MYWKEWRGIQCWDNRAKYILNGSSMMALARSLRAAEMSVGEPRSVLLAGMKLAFIDHCGVDSLKDGSAWT